MHLIKFLRHNAQVLVHGNATEDEAKRIAEDVRTELRCAPLPKACATIRRGAMLEPGIAMRISICGVVKVDIFVGTEYVHRLSALDYNPNEQNSAIEMLLFTTRSPGAGDCALSGVFCYF